MATAPSCGGVATGRVTNKLGQLSLCRPGVDRLGGNTHALSEVVRLAGRNQRRRRVYKDNVTPRTGFTVEHSPGNLGIGFGIVTLQFGRVRPAHSKILRSKRSVCD